MLRESLFKEDNPIITCRHFIAEVDEESERLGALVIDVHGVLVVIMGVIFH